MEKDGYHSSAHGDAPYTTLAVKIRLSSLLSCLSMGKNLKPGKKNEN